MRDRRRQYYTDRKIQGYFLSGIIAIEVLLVIGLLWALHSDISQVIDAQLYRIHQPDAGAWPEIFRVLGQILLIFFLINMVLFMAIHYWWGRFIKRIAVHLSATLEKIAKRDFNSAAARTRPLHRVSVLVDTWFDKEQKRHQRLMQLQHSIEQTAKGPLSEAEQAVLRERLGEMRRELAD